MSGFNNAKQKKSKEIYIRKLKYAVETERRRLTKALEELAKFDEVFVDEQKSSGNT